MHSRRLAIPARPLEVARRLADREGVALLFSATGQGPSYVLCEPSECVCAFDPEAHLPVSSDAGAFGHVPRWFGVLPYESRRTLERAKYRTVADARPPARLHSPQWWRYRAAAVVTERVVVVGEDAASVAELARLLEREPQRGSIHAELVDAEAPELHLTRIERALEHIRAGDLYQVNVARRHALRVQGHPLDLLEASCRYAPAPYAAALRAPEFDLVSTSPELFLRLTAGGVVETSPIKGTRPRGRDAAHDLELKAALDVDPKERAELAMVIDVERNDLGRLATAGSVRLSQAPEVRTYGSVHHRLATVSAQLRSGISRAQLIETMLPSGSVTGAPKIRAMEVIAELEAHRRGLYTGAFGVLRQSGELELAMAIRTLTVSDGLGEYFAGGGIVADSDPWRELEETHWKAVQLTALLSGAGGPSRNFENWAVLPDRR